MSEARCKVIELMNCIDCPYLIEEKKYNKMIYYCKNSNRKQFSDIETYDAKYNFIDIPEWCELKDKEGT